MRRKFIASVILCFAVFHFGMNLFSMTKKSCYDTTDLKWDTVYTMSYKFCNNTDTIIRRNIYEISDEIVERLVDSFLVYDPCFTNFLHKPVIAPHLLAISSGPILGDMDKPISLDSIVGLYRFERREHIIIYGIGERELENLSFYKTPDSVNIIINHDQLLFTCQNKYLFFHYRTPQDSSRVGFWIQGSTVPIETRKNKHFKWINEIESITSYTDTVYKKPHTPE